MTVSDDEIERLCKSMKETAMRNTWQDSEKSKIKDVTKNVLVSWGVLKEVEGKVYPTNAYALLTGKMPQMPVIQCGVFKGTNRAHFVMDVKKVMTMNMMKTIMMKICKK